MLPPGDGLSALENLRLPAYRGDVSVIFLMRGGANECQGTINRR